MAFPEAGSEQASQLRDTQAQALGELAQTGKWAAVKLGMFPLLPRSVVEHALEVAFDNRLSLIGAQMEQLKGMAEMAGGDEPTQDRIRGKALELQKEVVEIASVRYADTKPVSASNEERAGVLDLKIDELSKSLVTYEEWKDVKLSEKFGFVSQEQGDKKSYLDELADLLIEQTVIEIEKLSKERIALMK